VSDAEAGNRPNTALLVVLGVAVLVALVFFVILPLLGGDDDPAVDDTDVVVVDGESPVPAPSPTEDFELADPGEVEGDPPAETFEVFNARDPFQQLVDDETQGDGTTTGGTPTLPPGTTPVTPTTPITPAPGATTPPPGTAPPPTGGDDDGSSGSDGSDDGSDGSTDDGSGSSTAGDGTNGSDAQVGGTTVTLVDVFDDEGERKATITVNGTGYNVAEGETFGRRFRLLDISGRCATMLFGDSRFTLCEGERIRK
jgi:hypothetical protein